MLSQTKSTNSGKITTIENLSHDVVNYLFGFFSCNQLKNNRLVSKWFKDISNKAMKDLIKRTSDQIFYAVGEPILLDQPILRNRLTLYLKMYDPWENFGLNFRKDITENEIISSFQPKERIKVFRSEESALSYSCYLRKIERFIQNGFEYERVYQPAIFKVQYLETLSNIEFVKKDMRIRPDAGRLGLDDNELDRDVTIEFFEANRNVVVPIVGILKIEYYNKGNFVEYPPANFNKTNKDTYLKNCVII